MKRTIPMMLMTTTKMTHVLAAAWRRGPLALLALLALLLAPVHAAEDDLLEPEKAFRFSARAVDEQHVEVRFDIAEGYYVYREQFKFAAVGPDGAAVELGPPGLPKGKVKFDETFQKEVETYRGALAIPLTVRSAAAPFKLKVTSQGCADRGLCYPPMDSHAKIDLRNGAVALLTADEAAAWGSSGSTVTVSAQQDANNAAASDPATAALQSGRFWLVIGAFFVGGLLLSLTPCVLPMLPILSSLIVGQAHAASGGEGTRHARPISRGRGFSLALSYSLGMALLYTLLGVAAGLAGEGLAAALQNVWVLGAFALMLVLLSLSMFGLYELQLPSALQSRLNSAANKMPAGQMLGVFAMGGISALIVSPCVAAPLAGALLYISQTRDVALGGVALFTLAAGMSVPLLLLGASAGALLPRAGAWMDGVKRGFGMLLLAVALWIVQPVLPASLAVALWGVLLLASAVLLRVFDRLSDDATGARRALKAAGVVLSVLGVIQIVGAAAGARDPLKPLQPFTASGSANIASHGVSFQRVRSLAELESAIKTAGRPVMLDFYADWCVSCKEMERFTFIDARVQARLANALLVQADVTANNAADRELLKRFKLFGPPGIIFFDGQGRELESARVIGYQDADRFMQSLQAAGL